MFIKIDDLVFASYLKINRSLDSYKDPSDFGKRTRQLYLCLSEYVQNRAVDLEEIWQNSIMHTE
jgi:hypothetical protein